MSPVQWSRLVPGPWTSIIMAPIRKPDSPPPGKTFFVESPEQQTIGIAELNDRNQLPSSGKAFLDSLLRYQLLSAQSMDEFLDRAGAPLSQYTDGEVLGHELVKGNYLTKYQLSRVLTGKTHGLVLGNHRILDRLGSGSMGEVYVAEHLFMKRKVAIKVLPVDEDCPARLLERFYSEMQVLATLHHPHIVMAYDAGKVPPPHPGMPDMLYLAMELIWINMWWITGRCPSPRLASGFGRGLSACKKPTTTSSFIATLSRPICF